MSELYGSGAVEYQGNRLSSDVQAGSGELQETKKPRKDNSLIPAPKQEPIRCSACGYITAYLVCLKGSVAIRCKSCGPEKPRRAYDMPKPREF